MNHLITIDWSAITLSDAGLVALCWLTIRLAYKRGFDKGYQQGYRQGARFSIRKLNERV